MSHLENIPQQLPLSQRTDIFTENIKFLNHKYLTEKEYKDILDVYTNLCDKIIVEPIKKLFRDNYNNQIKPENLHSRVDLKMQNSTTKIFFRRKQFISLLNLGEHLRSIIGVHNEEYSSPIFVLLIKELSQEEVNDEYMMNKLDGGIEGLECIELSASYYGIKTLNKIKITELLKGA